ncbi:MAG TPA: DUF2934 domain-containing protein [Bryobacteraceae bacterium]|nr:DUF2934 domain-containing protein [Bryobacteraceae bacterium]
MPRVRKTEAELSSPAAETKRSRAKTAPKVIVDAPAQTAALSHKHAARKGPEPNEQPAPPARRDVAHDEIAKLAYSYWEARGYSGGPPEDDWFRAERELLVAAQNR